MNRRLLASLQALSLKVRPYWDLAVVAPITNLSGSLPILGSMVDGPGMQSAFAQLNAFNIADAQVNFQTSAGATLTIASMQGLVQRLTNGGAVTVTFDSAYNLVNQIPGAWNGQAFGFVIATNAGTTVATPTLSDTAVTLAGTTSVLAAALRQYVFQITQLTSNSVMPMTAGSTFTSIAQVGATNNFTVTLATNALVPVVGQLFPITVTTGTLPSGWYPINKVTSATSFVIATPPGTVWTATAGTPTMPGVAPQTYSPLVTITGAWATVTATISV